MGGRGGWEEGEAGERMSLGWGVAGEEAEPGEEGKAGEEIFQLTHKVSSASPPGDPKATTNKSRKCLVRVQIENILSG